jgi:addiction module RelE/StbE family toxin
MKVLYKDKFEKKFKKLNLKIQEHFYERLEIFIINRYHPILNNHYVGKKFPGCRSINITGNYRAIFEDLGEIINFVIIGTHSELYK